MTDASPKCQWCGQTHTTVCFMVKALEYHPDGSLKRVEFKTGADYSQVAAGPYPPQPRYPYPFINPYPQTTCGGSVSGYADSSIFVMN